VDQGLGLTSAEARAILTAAATPGQAAALTLTDLAALLRQAGRQRNITTWANRLHETFGREQLRQPPEVEQALGRHATTLLRQLDAACRGADDLADAITDALDRHPDAKVILSFPGLGPVTGSRILAEIGDDRSRFADARALNAYAGAAPITRASGKSRVIQTPQSQEPAPRSHRLPLGLRRPRLTRRPSPPRPAQNHRRAPHRRAAQPVQPHARPTPSLPAHRPALPGNPRLPATTTTPDLAPDTASRGSAPHPGPPRRATTTAGSPPPGTTRAAREPRPGQDQAATRSPPASPDPAENPGQEHACPAEESPHLTTPGRVAARQGGTCATVRSTHPDSPPTLRNKRRTPAQCGSRRDRATCSCARRSSVRQRP
jgi:Transposase IS116/IS110/IS902 family